MTSPATPPNPPPEASELDELEEHAITARDMYRRTNMLVQVTTMLRLIAAARSHAEMAAEVERLRGVEQTYIDEELDNATTDVFAAIGANETPYARLCAGKHALRSFRERIVQKCASLCDAEAQLMGSYEGKQARRLAGAIRREFGLAKAEEGTEK